MLKSLEMVLTTYGIVVQESDHSNIVGAPLVLPGYSGSAVTWVNKCGVTPDPVAAYLMRWLGRIEMRAGWCFRAAPISAVKNVSVDGIFSF